MQTTEVARRERLVQSLKQIYRDVQQLLINDHYLWELQEIVRENNEFRNASGLFRDGCLMGIHSGLAFGVRRQAGDRTAS
ncbi:MAG: hypothetical protein ACJ746_02320 [Bryobacteraceae bacterium]